MKITVEDCSTKINLPSLMKSDVTRDIYFIIDEDDNYYVGILVKSAKESMECIGFRYSTLIKENFSPLSKGVKIRLEND